MEKEGEGTQGGACRIGLKGGERRSERIVRTQNAFLFAEIQLYCEIKIIVYVFIGCFSVCFCF